MDKKVKFFAPKYVCPEAFEYSYLGEKLEFVPFV